MMPRVLKRKREELEDLDEEPAPGRQILPVANLPEDFDGEPMDGMQYLFTVRRDARYLPRITRVANPYETPEAPIVPPLNQSLQATHSAVPSEEWRASFVKHFKNFRKNVMQPTIHIHIPQNAKHKIMPDKRERDCWWAFLAGRPEADWNPPKKPKSDASLRRRLYYGRVTSHESDPAEDLQSPQETWHINDEGEVELALSNDPTESLPTPSGTPAPPELSGEAVDPLSTAQNQHASSILIQREPTPSLMAHVDHRTSLHLLMYFTHWINVHLAQPDLLSSGITETHARWIFVLLSRVEDYISADDMSLLRNLARASLALLKERMRKENLGDGAEEILKVSREEAVEYDVDMSKRSCWIVIVSVAGVWGQRDLWMDVDSMLAGLTG